MKGRIKNLTRIFLWIGITIIVILVIERLTVHKSPEYLMMDEFYRLKKNSVDVLAIGSSHAYNSFDTEKLWNDFGIAAYCISSPSQALSTSYYYLMEALKTQHPKVVMIECSLIYTTYLDYDYGNINSISWMRPSINKWKALKNSIPESYQDEMMFNIKYYHNRWRGLTKDDFLYAFYDNVLPASKGFFPGHGELKEDNTIPIYSVNNCAELSPDGVDYMNRIIQLCKEKNITLLPYLSPHFFMEGDYQVINAWRDFFAENGIEFIDGVQLQNDIEIIPAKDIANQHTSYWGAEKLFKYIGEYLISNDLVQDRRMDSSYKNWYNNSRYFEMISNSWELLHIDDSIEYIEKIKELQGNIIFVRSAIPDSIEEVDLSIFKELGISYDENSSKSIVAIFQDGELIWQQQDSEIENDIVLTGVYPQGIDYKEMPLAKQNLNEWKLHVYVKSECDDKNNMIVNYERINDISVPDDVSALKICVYNYIKGKCIDDIYIDMKTNEITRPRVLLP